VPCRLLALDIDGTVVNSQDQVSAATRDALHKAREHGVQIVLATGRRYSRALPLVTPLGIDVPVITASGGLIKNPLDHRTLFQAQFDRLALLQMLEFLAGQGHDVVLYGDTFDAGFDYWCPRVDEVRPELREFFDLNPGCEQVKPDLIAQPPAGVFAGFAIGNKAEMVKVQQQLETLLADDLSLHVIRSPRYTGYMCELGASGISKWSGIMHLAEQWQIAPEDIWAVGDDVNDLQMIEHAGVGIAMANAAGELKAIADRIAPSNDQDGVAVVVDWLLAET